MRKVAMLVALWLAAGCCLAASGDAPALFYSIPPGIQSGWDLRDENNRPVNDPELERQMRALEVEGVFIQVFSPGAPTFRAILAFAKNIMGEFFWGFLARGSGAPSVAVCPANSFKKPEKAKAAFRFLKGAVSSLTDLSFVQCLRFSSRLIPLVLLC